MSARRRLVEHWWNRSWGTRTHRSLHLYRHDDIPEGTRGAWVLEVRNGRDWTSWPYRFEGKARYELIMMIAKNDIGEFTQLTAG